MAVNFTQWVESLKAKADISSVVGSYVTLEQKGSRQWACCPFHHEKTPSFSIDESKQIFYCYGCHAGGDVIAFVSKIENTDFMGAITILASKYNMQIPEFGSKRDDGLKQKKDRLREMMKITGQYYHENLMSGQGEPARKYLQNRGISLSTIKTFGLGYSLGYNQLVVYLKSKGFSYEDMQDAGLSDQKDGKYYDSMAGRFIVPIINNMKEVIAFGGRVIEKDKMPKYKNTRETILFNKSQELFGQHSLKKLMLEEPVSSVIMVEGYMDVISLYQAGIRNAMASMGTALTPEQARLLKRYCNKVVICYDGDSAGQKATVRGLDILYNADLDVRVMSLPNNADPDEYVRDFGKDGFLQQIMQAKPLFEFKLLNLAEKYDFKSAEDKGKYAVEAMKILKTLNNPAQIEAYIPIVVALTGINKEVLYKQLNQTEAPPPHIVAQKQKLSMTAFDKAVRYALFGLFGGIDGAKCDSDLSQNIINIDQRRLYDIYRGRRGQALNINDLIQYEDENPEVKEILNEGSKISDEQSQIYFVDCLNTIQNITRKQQTMALSMAIDSETDEEAKSILMAQLAQITKQKDK